MTTLRSRRPGRRIAARVVPRIRRAPVAPVGPVAPVPPVALVTPVASIAPEAPTAPVAPSPRTPVADPPSPVHVAPRSALAQGPTLAPALSAAMEAALPESPGTRPSAVRRRVAILLAVALVVAAAAVAFAGTRVVLARFTDAATVAGSTFATGTWAPASTWYLHGNPTPPTGDTTATLDLALDASAPTTGTLFNYDTDCDSRAGRSLDRGTGQAGEGTACRFATWRSSALADARVLDGTATLTIWARKSTSGGANPTLRAFLRVFDPATSAYTELGAADGSVVPNANQAWARLDLSWSLAKVAVPAGRRIEVKLVATGGTRDAEVAYDTTSHPSSLTLP